MRGLVGLWLATAALAVVGCGESSAPTREEPRATISGYGINMALPPGWNGRVFRRSPKHSITLQAGTIPLPPLGDDVTPIARRMKAEDAYLVIDDIGPPPPGLREGVWDLNPKLPLAIDDNEIQGPWKGGFPSGTAFAVVVSERALMVRVFFGSHPSEAQIEQANAVLATLSVAPSRAPQA